jgi:hypothetical protein
LNLPYVRMNHVVPRFQAVARDSLYNEPTGYGWSQCGPRALSPLPLTTSKSSTRRDPDGFILTRRLQPRISW